MVIYLLSTKYVSMVEGVVDYVDIARNGVDFLVAGAKSHAVFRVFK